jgi:hypothetical protein
VGASFSGPPLQVSQAIPNSLMMMPASAAIAAAEQQSEECLCGGHARDVAPRG